MASEKIAQLIEEVKVLSVLELSELVHALEEEFGVSAAAAVAAAPAAGAACFPPCPEARFPGRSSYLGFGSPPDR